MTGIEIFVIYASKTLCFDKFTLRQAQGDISLRHRFLHQFCSFAE